MMSVLLLIMFMLTISWFWIYLFIYLLCSWFSMGCVQRIDDHNNNNIYSVMNIQEVLK